MPRPSYKSQVLDARPDRLDLRDRAYRPHLDSLPSRFPLTDSFMTDYADSGLILDQGEEGACVGFGLAATINYLIWKDVNRDSSSDDSVKNSRVSERMLYHMARVYDEWDGEDYSGSSCRGGMKGWHRHGVCKKSIWPYDVSGRFLPPVDDSWAVDALNNPLGAYYRIQHDSVVDMQAAIAEVGAIYCSSDVHEGWWLDQTNNLPVIKQSNTMTGGHAYCIVGYNEDGFIIQNSWGTAWGKGGFAILTYADWVQNGNDAWVVARGVKIKVKEAPRMFANNSLQDLATKRNDPAQANISKALAYPYPASFKAKPWSEDTAYAHSLVIGNNGRPRHKVISAEGPEESAKQVCEENLRDWLLKSSRNRKVVIYAHGGLNSEEDSINRVRVMAPYFKANGIYPIFVIWRSGLLETLENIIREGLGSIFKGKAEQGGRAEGFGEWLTDKTDRAIEALARGIRVKGLWSEMKENALYASDRAVPGFAQNKAGKAGAMVLLAESLEQLTSEFPDIQLNMVGHSAGAILLGAWLKEIEQRKLKIRTASLFAPACTIEFSNRTYKPAVEKKVLDKKGLFIHLMDDEREKADNTGRVYRKSLLYLVSRALEDVHKMPLLGMDAAWDTCNCRGKKSGGFNQSQKAEIAKWSKFSNGSIKPIRYKRDKNRVKINLRPDYINLGHGSFDNDIDVIEFTIRKIRGRKPIVEVVNLCGY